jgi:uncharacterized protein YndB with AHSA1/START domain
MTETGPEDAIWCFSAQIAAPRSLIYRCWTQPEHLIPQWFVPRPHKVTACGRWMFGWAGRCNTTFEVEGNVMDNTGVYLEVIPGEKLVFTDAYTVGWKPAPEPFMTAIVILRRCRPGLHDCIRAVARHRNARDLQSSMPTWAFFDGWGTVATQLEAYAQGVEGMIPSRFATLTFERKRCSPLCHALEGLDRAGGAGGCGLHHRLR